ncbi:hypothetical protein OEZ86_005002 [Tetradesmus obliquus]|nr:hypothetical protein OEZ86_005002 [Tetradesmus obliquus]
MADDDGLNFDFEEQLDVQPEQPAEKGNLQLAIVSAEDEAAAAQQVAKEKNYRQTVCAFWLRGMCMKGESCGFLHKFDPERMPVCRVWMKTGECKELDCPFKHSLDDVKECNMYKLGFCIYGPNCRYKHTKQPGPPPDPDGVEAAKPREHRDWRKIMAEDSARPGQQHHDHRDHRDRDRQHGSKRPRPDAGGGREQQQQPMLALPAPPQQQQQQQDPQQQQQQQVLALPAQAAMMMQMNMMQQQQQQQQQGGLPPPPPPRGMQQQRGSGGRPMNGW